MKKMLSFRHLILITPVVLAAQSALSEETPASYGVIELRETFTEIFGEDFTSHYSDDELATQGYDLLLGQLEDGSALLVSRVSAAIAIQEVTAAPVPDGLFENLMSFALTAGTEDEQLSALELLAGQAHPDNLYFLEQFLGDDDASVRKETVYQIASQTEEPAAYDLLLNYTLMYPGQVTDLLISELSVSAGE